MADRCRALTRKGHRCPFDAFPAAALCHVHHPDGAYRRQHPGKAPNVIPMTAPPSLVGVRDWQLG